MEESIKEITQKENKKILELNGWLEIQSYFNSLVSKIEREHLHPVAFHLLNKKLDAVNRFIYNGLYGSGDEYGINEHLAKNQIIESWIIITDRELDPFAAVTMFGNEVEDEDSK